MAPRFAFGELFGFARDRLAQLGGAALDDDDVRRMLRQLMPMLERYRFVREVPRERDLIVADERILYEALPGLYHYDARKLGPDVIARALAPVDELADGDDGGAEAAP